MIQNELKNLEEAADEIELLDEETQIPFLIGEVFISNDLSKTQVCHISSTHAILIYLHIKILVGTIGRN